MYIAYYTYKPTHTERHYLVSTDETNTRCTVNDRNESNAREKALKFSSEYKAFKAIHELLKSFNYGLDWGYSFTAHVERVES